MTNASTGSAGAHDLDSFLGHKNRTGGGASFLGNWKGRTPPEVRVVLHTKAPIISVWQHAWPKIVTREVDGKEVNEVWSGTFNSWEVEEVLQRQYIREDDGTRSYPPQVCPMAILLEEVERLMRDGELDWRAPLFKFAGDDPTKGKTLHAGSMTNKVKKIWEDASDKDKRQARKAGFPGPGDAWKESMMAKCQYVFTVVEFDKPSDGIQIAKETTLVGDKVKKVIRDRMTSEGDDEGNPLKNPYVLQFKHDKNAKQFQDRYDVVAIGKLKVTDEILALIREKDAPDLTRYTAPGDIEALRASMEDAYCGPADLLDWNFIFGKAEALAGIEDEPEDDDDDDTEGETKEETTEETTEEETPEVDRIIAKRKGKGENQRCYNAAGEELGGCEECSAIMLESEEVCHKCGADYSEDDGEGEEGETTPEPDPEPAPPPKRSKKATTKGKGNGATKAKKGATKGKGGKASDRAAASGGDVGF